MLELLIKCLQFLIHLEFLKRQFREYFVRTDIFLINKQLNQA
jgi:hypothetical protein